MRVLPEAEPWVLALLGERAVLCFPLSNFEEFSLQMRLAGVEQPPFQLVRPVLTLAADPRDPRIEGRPACPCARHIGRVDDLDRSCMPVEGCDSSRRCLGDEPQRCVICLLYTSDAADERSSVDLGGRRII